mgnify:CR=1 FL=1
MSVEEIEEAIRKLSKAEFNELDSWLSRYRISDLSQRESSNGTSDGSTLYDKLKDYIGVVGDPNGPKTSSRKAGEQFTDHLVKKKQDGRL